MIPLLLAASLAIAEPAGPLGENKLPPEAERALRAPGKVTLYSLEPGVPPIPRDKALHDVKTLGQTELDGERSATAIAEFKSAVAHWDGMTALCFDPRHAIRVTANGRTYDFLLCYECHQLYIYRNDQLLKTLGAAGSPKILNALLSAAKIPRSKSAEETEAQEDDFHIWLPGGGRESSKSAEKIEAQEKAANAVEARWRDAMPKSLVPFWDNGMQAAFEPDVAPLRSALAKEFPAARQRILALFAWYGSGEGPWSGFPSYEEVAEKLLVEYPAPDLIAAAQTETLTEPQLEGAARLFGAWIFGQRRPADLEALPAPLKKKLLDHSLKSTDQDKLQRARSAFGEP